MSGGPADVGDICDDAGPHHREICEKLKPSPGPHILTGPVAVRGAEPGDTLEVRIKAIELTVDWGWNIIRPLRGTLPEDFPNSAAASSRSTGKAMTAKLPWGADHSAAAVLRHPRRGAARRSTGACSSVEPREFGGNLDNKELVAGTSLFLPVFVPGANFSCGDGHAVQGDGEVCLTALETCLDGHVRARAAQGPKLAFPRAVTPTHYITMGLDPDLDDAAKQALRDMIRWLVEMKGWSPRRRTCSAASPATSA